MAFDFTGIVEIVISILATIATCFIIPLLKEKLEAEKLKRIIKWVKIAVDAAEQLYGSGTGQEKREYVVNYLLKKGIVFDVDEMEMIIESAVFRLPEWLETQFNFEDEEVTVSESEVE